jgi:sarcosine oxidase subunit alpha
MRGDLLPIEPGLDVRAVNTSGGLAHDRYHFTERMARFLPVGFYYKAFHTPRRLFPFYENMMRKVAGLGSICPAARTPPSAKDYAFCELLVVGAGPAGLSAAVAAAEAGVDVLLVDEQPRIGGSCGWQQIEATVRDDLIARAQKFGNLQIRLGTQAAGWYADHWVALVDGAHLTKLRACAVLVAAGCIEQPAVFQNNDLPGVMLGSAAQRLVQLYAVKPFDRAVVLAANNEGYKLALDLKNAGVDVAAIVDLRAVGEQSSWANRITEAGIQVLTGHTVYEALASRDKTRVAGVVIRSLDQDGQPRSDSHTIPCDGVAVSVGGAPNACLLAMAGTRFGYSEPVEQLVPRELPQGIFAAGRVNGIFAPNDQLADGRRAGLAAAAYLGRSVQPPPAFEHVGPPPSHPYPIFKHAGKKNFVDLDEDLHLADFVNAHQEGYDNVELMKRYATFGMGPSQGKISNTNAVRILARLNGRTIEGTGTTTARPFHQPVSLAHLAGRRFHPYRLTPMDGWHRQAGAPMVHVGAWFRPEYYPVAGKSRDDCILDEAQHVRNLVGLIDLSTLGKLHVNGPGAAQFLEQIYTGRFATQKNGTMRYAVACDESGILLEEGLVVRLADDQFYLTASTTGGDAFYRELQRWAIIWGSDVVLANATGHWAAMNLAGPDARRVLAKLTGADLDPAAFPYAAVRVATVAGTPAVLIRAGFLGELGYEIHLPASRAAAVWDAVLSAGAEFQLRPFGIEAQRLLRLEKGHLIAGHDTDALTTPYEAQLDWAIGKDKPHFIGSRSLAILRKQPLTRKLIGISFAPDYSGPLPEECQLIIDKGQICGRVTSIAVRSTLGRAIGLAFVRPDMAVPGTEVNIRVAAGKLVTAYVTALPFYDPQNNRQKM